MNYNIQRTIQAMREAIADTSLDLSGLTIYTEAATGAYCITPALAALAGAQKVYALARDNRYGTAEQAWEESGRLADKAGAPPVIEFVSQKEAEHLAKTDILTNSGNVRPIDQQTLEMLTKPTAVVPLMYEAWEIRPQDLDYAACVEKGIAVAGTNENHPQVNFFQYLGVMVIKMLLESRFEILGTTIGLACDNTFAPHIAAPLAALGAKVVTFGHPDIPLSFNGVEQGPPLDNIPSNALKGLDALVISASPTGTPIVVGRPGKAQIDAEELLKHSPGIELFEFCWGGALDRVFLQELNIRVHPAGQVSTGHMAVIPSDLGAVPLVRLQAGGLKVGELLARKRLSGVDTDKAVAFSVDSGYGQRIIEIQPNLR